jgi:hypothetical protein
MCSQRRWQHPTDSDSGYERALGGRILDTEDMLRWQFLTAPVAISDGFRFGLLMASSELS